MKKNASIVKIVLGAIFLFFGAKFFEQTVPHRGDHDVWDIFTALGTVGAVASAVWLGLRQESIRTQEERFRGSIVATRLRPVLEPQVTAFQSVHALMAGYTDFDNRWNILHSCKELLKSATFAVQEKDLVALSALPGGCAIKLARSAVLVDSLSESIGEWDSLRWSELTAGEREAEIRTWNGRMIEVHRLVDHALKDIKNAEDASSFL